MRGRSVRTFECRECGQVVTVENCPSTQRHCPECKAAKHKKPEFMTPKKRKPKKTMPDISKTNAAAREAGMTYGQYVAMLRGARYG